MSVAALALWASACDCAAVYSPRLDIAAAVPLLRVAAFFQLFDGLQITATGALRGAGDTRTPMLCHLAGYWRSAYRWAHFYVFTSRWER